MRQLVRKALVFGAMIAILFSALGCGDKTVQVPAGGGSSGSQVPRMSNEGGPGFGQGGMGGAPSPTREIMTKLMRGPQSLNSAIKRALDEEPPPWITIKPQAKEYAQLAVSLGKEEPPKGSKESWIKLTAAFAEMAAALDKAAAAEDRTAALTAHETLSTSCNACHQEHRGGPGGRGGFGGGPGGFGGPGAGDRGGPGGFGGQGGGGFGGPPQPGQLLAPFIQDRLNLTPEQKKQLEDLQKKVDSDLGKILTDEQKQQLKEMQGGMGRGGRGGFGLGGPGRGSGGPGGPAGPPEGGPDGRGPGGARGERGGTGSKGPGGER